MKIATSKETMVNGFTVYYLSPYILDTFQLFTITMLSMRPSLFLIQPPQPNRSISFIFDEQVLLLYILRT